MASLTQIKQRFWNNDGTVAAGGKVYVYLAGTTNLTNSYTDSTGATPNANPVILDSKGEAAIFTDRQVKLNVVESDVRGNAQITGYPMDYTGQVYANLAGSSSQTFSVAPATAGTMAPAANQMIGRNMIVNGSCQVDQVNSGAIISPLVSNSYVVDNLNYGQNQTGKLSGQQITTSLNSLGATHAVRTTVLAQFTPAAGDYFSSGFSVEGLNLAHLQWGTANAATVSLQFKARASVTGTYGATFRNVASTRSYGFTFALVANTDTQVKIENIPGCTDGAWVTDNTSALQVWFSYGTGSTLGAPSIGSWLAGNYLGVASALQLVAQVNGSTLDIADVQLEKGAFSTTFERKLYDQVLRECRRYARKSSSYVPATTAQNLITIDMRNTPTISGGGAGFISTGTTADSLIAFQTTAAVQSLLLEARL